MANAVQLFTGAIAGGEAGSEPSDVIVTARLTNHQGANLAVTFVVDNTAVQTVFYQPPEDGSPVDAEFRINALDILDAPNVAIELRVAPAAGGPGGNDSVNVRVDRAAPRVQFDLDALGEAQNGQCFPAPPVVPYEVVDNQDANPASAERNESQGCAVSRIVTATDNCGNGIEYSFTTRRTPAPNEIDVTLRGFVCGLIDCPTSGPDAVPFNAGARVGRASLVFDIEGPANCIDNFQTAFTVDGEEGDVFQFDSPLESPGDYDVTLVLGACGAEVARDDLAFTVLDRPTADVGGPYNVVQGAPLMLDASGSTAAPELGGIVEFAWDADGIQGYEQIAELRNGQWFLRGGNQAIANPERIAFDSTRGDGDFQVQVRVTAGNGGVEYGVGSVTVSDVHPVCAVTGPLVGAVGSVITFDSDGSGPGHASDPIISYAWDFGDNRAPQNADGLVMASHIFGSGGNYTVTLRVVDVDSDTSCTTEIEIESDGPIVQNIEVFNADRLLEGVEVGFGKGDSRPGNAFTPLVNYIWTFGPDNAGAEGDAVTAPRYTYNDDGDYQVCLTVVDAVGAEAEGCVNISVADLNPIAELDGQVFGVEGETIHYSAAGTRGSPADQLVAIIWDFGEPGVAPIRTEPPVFEMDHVFAGSGDFVVTITAVDEDSETVSTPINVSIEDVVPRIDVSVVYEEGAQSGVEGEPITFDASGSTPGAEVDPITTYTFDFGDGTIVEGPEAVVQHAYEEQGVFEVNVSITDSDGSTVGTTVVAVVVNRPPTVILTASELQVEIGESVTFFAEVDDVLGDLPPRKVRWDYGDGTLPEDGALEQEHAFLTVGLFRVRLVVDDYDGTCTIGINLQPGACGGANPDPACECPNLRPAACDAQPSCALVGGEGTAEIEIRVTPAAPRIERVGPFEVAEGEVLEFSVTIDAAQRDDDEDGNPQFDGPTLIGVPSLPRGATTEITDAGDPAAQQTLHFSWQPTFFDAGVHVVRVTALGPFSSIDRTREITITVTDAGTPFLVGAGGRASRGVVTVYEYTRDGDTPGLIPRAQVDIGSGAGGMAVSGTGKSVYVAVPGSGGVAVVGVDGEVGFRRRIPTGNGTSGVAWSPGRVWAANALDDTVTAIDEVTLKVIANVPAGVARPTDIVYLADGFDGIDGGHLAVVGARSGEIALLDAALAERGEPAVVATYRVGGVLTRIVADPSTGMLHVTDSKLRRVYHVSAASILANPEADFTDTVFGARDLLAFGGTVWIATDGGLFMVNGDDADLNPNISAKALASISSDILAGSGVAAAVGDRVENYDNELQRVLGAAGTRIRRLATFVARQ